MSKLAHQFYIWIMVFITVVVTAYLSWVGYSFYNTPLEERYYHPQYDWFKASGDYGHGLGIVGTLLITVGVVLYITAKKYGYLDRVMRLKHVLEFHIFLCTLGPIMVLFHTTFKFGGIVSIAFWSMVLVVLSGVIGRYIYLQIPQTMNGRALSLEELETMRRDAMSKIEQSGRLSSEILQRITDYDPPKGWGLQPFFEERRRLKELHRLLSASDVNHEERTMILSNAKTEITLNRKMRRLSTMQSLFKYWHVAHRPFALIMLIVVLAHVGVTLYYGYTWIF